MRWEGKDPRDAESFIRDATYGRAGHGMIGNDLAQEGARLKRAGEGRLGRRPSDVRGRRICHARLNEAVELEKS
jgi:hypothetical protein